MVANPVIAVGASSGGLEPLRRITEPLPRNCDATLFVVMHAGADSLLLQILSWHVKLRVEFNFVDYAKAAVRLSAIMHLPVIQIYTHDSIGLGQDGPTHQPVEQLVALRSVPGLVTLRPADASEHGARSSD
jgi:hypothetical protein